MRALDFFVDFASTGSIYGLGLASTPEQWSINLGDDYTDDVDKKQLRRDYGLVEVTFSRTAGSWRCINIAIQAHRLWWMPENAPGKLRNKYGDFPRFTRFEEVRHKLELLNLEVRLINDKQESDHVRYYVPATKTLIYALSSEIARDSDDMPPGALWSMYLTIDADIWAKPTRQTR